MISLDSILENVMKPQTGLVRKSNPAVWRMDTFLDAVRAIGRQIDPRFVIDDQNRLVYENLIYWVMNDQRIRATDPFDGRKIQGRPSRGIYLAGQTGTGKTVAMQIVRQLYNSNRFTVPSGSSMKPDKVIYWEEYRADQITDDFSNTGDLTKYKKAPLLCIQDLGCEPAETLYMGNRSNVLRQILEYRGDLQGQVVTLITSNIPIKALEERYGARVASRITEMCNYIVLQGADRRKNI